MEIAKCVFAIIFPLYFIQQKREQYSNISNE